MLSWITRFWDVAGRFLRLLPPPAKIWQQILGHLASWNLCSQGQGHDALSSVAAEDPLVSLK